MLTENDDLVAAILVLKLDRPASSPAELVRSFDAIRDELLTLRETKSRLQLEEWEKHGK